MARFLFFALLAVLVWAWWSRHKGKGSSTSVQPPPAAGPKLGPDEMTACAHCGLHFPQSEGLAVTHGEHTDWYCSPSHRDQGPKRRAPNP
jgi:uncharacterized protein